MLLFSILYKTILSFYITDWIISLMVRDSVWWWTECPVTLVHGNQQQRSTTAKYAGSYLPDNIITTCRSLLDIRRPSSGAPREGQTNLDPDWGRSDRTNCPCRLFFTTGTCGAGGCVSITATWGRNPRRAFWPQRQIPSKNTGHSPNAASMLDRSCVCRARHLPSKHNTLRRC